MRTVIVICILFVLPTKGVVYQGVFSGGPSCRRGHVFPEVIVDIVPVTSLYHCVTECNKYPLCLSFNYCAASSGVTCELSTEPTDGTCDQLVARSECDYYEKLVA